MTTKYIFYNFTDKPFTGYWNGKPYTFKPGVKKYYTKGIAEHFAKHLTNEILTARGSVMETFTSPKKPQEVPEFMKIFNQALLTEEVPDADNLEIGGEEAPEEPSMNIRTTPRAPIDPYDAHAQPAVGPGSEPQILDEPAGDDGESSEYEETPAKQP